MEIQIDNETMHDALTIAVAQYSGCSIEQAKRILEIPGIHEPMLTALNNAALDIVQGIICETS